MDAVEMIDVTKRFGPVVANEGVTFTARAGEVHALLGENGAGKSTLMSILAGLYRQDEGVVKINGEVVQFRSPRDAISHGVGMVYQHFMLVDSFTVAENAMLGQQRRGLQLDTTGIERELTALGTRYNLHVDPQAYIWQLSVGEQQRVEIVRLLYRGAKILIFDEPTAVLTPQEARDLLHTLRSMAAEGYCIIFISHHLDEVMEVADRVTVLRRGRVVTTVETSATSQRELARLMVGREVLMDVDRPPATTGDVVLDVRELAAQSDKNLPALHDVSLQVRAGEILGVAGVAGNGQRELAEVITGLRRATGGQVRIGGADMTNRSPREIIAAGVAHIPEDRMGTGLIGNLDLSDNSILKEYRRSPLARGLLLIRNAIAGFTDRLLADYNVAAPGRHVKVRLLSGGNQQKMLLARELSGEPQLLVAVHPTRGVDIGATESIQQLLLTQRARGSAILLISEDLHELLALSDRVAVLYGGRLMGVVDAATAAVEHLGPLMAGVPLSEAMANA
jgi:simple sugar transport system ATP-binding protein